MEKRGFLKNNKEAGFLRNKQARFKMNKKGVEITLETVIFIVSNIIFIAVLIVFVIKYSAGAAVLEQIYAKQIALLIDGARPGTYMNIDLRDAINLARDKSSIPFGERGLDSLASFDEETRRVIVSITGKRGYSYQVFTDYDVEICMKLAVDGGSANIFIEEKGKGQNRC